MNYRWAALSALAIIGTRLGCIDPLPASCRTDEDCADERAFCDLEINQCFWRPADDAGTAPDAGIDAGGDAGACLAACASHQECVGSACLARYDAIVLDVVPGVRGPGAAVAVTATLELADGRSPGPFARVDLTVTSPSGTAESHQMSPAGSGYEAAVTLGAEEGAYVLVASYGTRTFRARR